MEKSSPRHIIFATDFSARCDRAQDRAIQLAVQWQARLTAVHVIEDEDDFLELRIPMKPDRNSDL